MLKQELLSIWKDKKFTLSIIVMVFMPILYSGMLLWAFWDPYSKLDELPVALVNEDSGAILDGEQLALGAELIDKLIQDKQFDFFEVSSEEAEKRLKNHDYYLLIKIPENFSQHATTLLEDNPEKLQIDYLPNEGFNFLSAKIGDTAIEKIRQAVNEQVAETYAETLYESIDKLSNGFVDAADGASSLTEGALEIQNGSADLFKYLQQLAGSTVQLSDGTEKLAGGLQSAQDGANKLATGGTTLADGASKLQAGAEQLADGANQLQQGISSYTEGANKIASSQQQLVDNQQQLQQGIESIASNTSALSEGASNLASGAASVEQGITELSKQIESVLPSLPAAEQQALKDTLAKLQSGSSAVSTGVNDLATNSAKIKSGATGLADSGAKILAGHEQIAGGLTELTSKSDALIEGAQTIATGNTTLAENIVNVSEGANQLASGATELANGLTSAITGATTLADGTSSLATKSGELADGAGKLVDGTSQLTDGATELKEALEDASEESKISYSDDTVSMTVNPVEVNKEVVNEVENYGNGFAPYFVSLGLFVGALLLTNVYPYVQPAIHPTSLVRWFGSKSFIPFVVMLGQVVLIIIVLKFALGLQVASMPLLILTTIITSFAFMAIVQVMTVVLGDVGRFLALVLLIIQLTASAGTFPVELLPGFFQKVHDFMPMKYSIQAYRDVIVGDYTNLTASLTILGVIGVICVVISFAFFALLYKRRYSKQVA